MSELLWGLRDAHSVIEMTVTCTLIHVLLHVRVLGVQTCASQGLGSPTCLQMALRTDGSMQQAAFIGLAQ